MPNYDYKCNDCQNVQQEFHGMKEMPKNLECSACQSGNLSKIISGGLGVHFRGTGFYQTDYKRKENENTSSE